MMVFIGGVLTGITLCVGLYWHYHHGEPKTYRPLPPQEPVAEPIQFRVQSVRRAPGPNSQVRLLVDFATHSGTRTFGSRHPDLYWAWFDEGGRVVADSRGKLLSSAYKEYLAQQAIRPRMVDSAHRAIIDPVDG